MSDRQRKVPVHLDSGKIKALPDDESPMLLAPGFSFAFSILFMDDFMISLIRGMGLLGEQHFDVAAF